MRIYLSKWKFDIRYYTWARHEIIDLITHEYDQKIKVLEVGCGMGATLAKIQYMWPEAEVFGIELVDSVAAVAANYLNVIQGDIEKMEMPYQKFQFDYIIMADVIEHLYDPESAIKRLLPYLKKDGVFLFSIPNFMHVSAMLPLLQGKMEYQDAGILDYTHIRFFTLESIHKLLASCGLIIDKLSCTLSGDMTTQEKEMLEALVKIPGIASEEMFQVYQYIVKARYSC